MRITFVALGWEQLGLSLLSAIAKQEGHDVNLAFSPGLFNDRYNLHLPLLAKIFDNRKDVLETVKKQKPDVLAFSPMTGTYQWMLGIAQEAKQRLPEVKTIFGGVHASAVPDLVLKNSAVDYVCVGEGDIAFPTILRQIEQNDLHSPILNTRYKSADGQIIQGRQNGFIQDLDSLPGFDKTIWEDHIRIGDIYFTMASRGCPLRCTYCFNSFFAKLPKEKPGKYVRHRSAEHMLKELRAAKQRYKIKLIEFEDDIFTCKKKWLKDFLKQYKSEIGIPFQCLSHPSFMDEDVVHWLSDSGCQFVQMGIQSMDETFKNEKIKRYEKSQQVEQVMKTMRKYSLALKVDHMFGLPGEPLQAQETARKLYTRNPPYRIQTFWVNYFPGTEIVQEALKTGILTPDEIKKLNAGEGFDFYHSSTKFIDSDKMKTYWAYETIFKLIPMLPQAFRNNINARFFQRLPKSLNAALSFFADVFHGLISRNPDHIGYAKYYCYHMTKYFLNRLGLKAPPATQPKDSTAGHKPLVANALSKKTQAATQTTAL